MAVRRLRGAAHRADVELQRLQRRAFELRFGVRTRGRAYLEDRGLGADERFCYQSSDWIATRRALRRLRPGPDDVLADLGCGKGPAVVLAARFPFRKVIGVELAPDLAAVARANVERARRHLRAREIEIVAADILTWPIPTDVSIVYLYSPVVGDHFSQLATRLLESFDEQPRPLRIVYNYPWEHNRLLATGRVRVLDVVPGRWPAKPRWWDRDEVIVTYSVTPASGAEAPPALESGPALARWSGPNDTVFRLDRQGEVFLSSGEGGDDTARRGS